MLTNFKPIFWDKNEIRVRIRLPSGGIEQKREENGIVTSNCDFKNFFIDFAVLETSEKTQEVFEKISCCVSLFRMNQLLLRLRKTEYLQDQIRGFLQRKVRQAIIRKQNIFQKQDKHLFTEQMQSFQRLDAINSEILIILDRQHSQQYFLFRVTAGDALKQKKCLEMENYRWKMKPVFAQICKIMNLNDFQRKMVSQLQSRDYQRCFNELTRAGLKTDSAQTIQRICCCISHFRAIEIRLATKRSHNLTKSQKDIFLDSLNKAILRKQKIQKSHIQLYLSQLQYLPQLLEQNPDLFYERNETNFEECRHFRITIQDVKQQKVMLEETIPLIERVKRLFVGLLGQDKNQNQEPQDR